jgi:quercetin dioxygenase-like cupin family protein
MMQSGFIVPGDGGRRIPLRFGGSEVTIKAAGDDTVGAATVYESRLEPHAPGPARHLHRSWTEMFYILEGEMTFQVGDEIRQAPAGTLVFIPPETVHAFRNPTSESARILVIVVKANSRFENPGGIDKYFEETVALPLSMTDPAWRSLNEKWDIMLVGPPLEG